MNTLQQQFHQTSESNIPPSANDLVKLPIQLLTTLLVSDFKSKKLKQKSLLNLPKSQSKQSQQNQSQPTNANIILFNIHRKWISNKLNALTYIQNSFITNEQLLFQIKQFVFFYLYNCQLMENCQLTISRLKEQLSQRYWSELLNYLLSQSIKKREVKQQTAILQQFLYTLTDESTQQYIKCPTSIQYSIYKQALELCVSIKPQQVSAIRIQFLNAYLKIANQQQRTSQKPLTVEVSKKSLKFQLLKIIQLFHLVDPSFRISQLATNRYFMNQHLYFCLCDFSTKGANALAINIYGSIMKQLELFDENVQVFIDIYLILDCYGMHLVKDVWDRFYILCQNSQQQEKRQTHYYIYPISKLLHIILSKVEQHDNHNVPKYCINSLLAASPKNTTPIFQHLQDTVYGSLVQILSTGTHYNDITHFHQDSKMYQLTKSFYLGYYNLLAQNNDYQKLKYHLKALLRAMKKFITFEHCIIAYIGIIGQIPITRDNQDKPLKLLDKEDIDILVELINKFFIKLTFRKRYKLLQSVLACLRNNINLQQVGLQYMMSLILAKLPHQIIQIQATKTKNNKIPDIYDLLLLNFSEQLQQRIAYLQLEQKDTEFQLINNKDILDQPQQHQLQIKKYWLIKKQLIILWVLLEYKTSQKQNSFIHNKIFKKLQTLANSTYGHPLLYASTIFSFSALCSFSKLTQISEIIKNNVEFQQNLLVVLTMCNNNKFINLKDISTSIQAVSSSIHESNNDILCKNYAKFIQYCISQLSSSDPQQVNYYLFLLINAIKFKLQYTKKYSAIEDSLYNLFDNVDKLANVTAKYKLRIQLMLFTILSNDFQFAWEILSIKKVNYINQIGDFFNLYDYKCYDEVFWFYIAVTKTMSRAHQKQLLSQEKWTQFSCSICGNIEKAIKIMLQNLDYGVHKKQVVSSVQCVVKVSLLLNINQQSIALINTVLDVGEKYWGFQRHTVFTLLNQFKQKKWQYWKYSKGLLKLFPKFVAIEEYRGQDTAILLTEHNQYEVYTNKKLHKKSDYDGTTVRFIAIQWAQRQLSQLINHKKPKDQSIQKIIKFWSDLFDNCFAICMTQNANQPMFLTGPHRTKIKICQFVLIYPQFLLSTFPKQLFGQILLKCIASMSHNNLQQIKHYNQLFLLKLIYKNPYPELLDQISHQIMNQLLSIQGQSSLFKNVSFMLVAGLILQLKYYQGLYSVLFCFVCSHIGYYRGISQYFCYKLIDRAKQQHHTDFKYIITLYTEFLKDEDAIKLSSKLQQIVQNYQTLVINWNIYDNLLNQQPILNGQVINSDSYIDKLKNLGGQLIKQHRHEDGYMAYKQIWKKIIKQQNELPNQQKQTKQTQNSFQKKIDPSLDDLYNFNPVTNHYKQSHSLKVIVITAEQIALYGHLARVGEIFGISELCIPNKNVIDMEEFYNVSVTAEKWLNITQHGFQKIKKHQSAQKQKCNSQTSKNRKPGNPSKKKHKQVKQLKEEEYQYVGKEKIFQMLANFKHEGYKLYFINKSPENVIRDPSQLKLTNKCILLIDELDILRQQLIDSFTDYCITFNSYYSSHVQSTILIWQFLKFHKRSLCH